MHWSPSSTPNTTKQTPQCPDTEEQALTYRTPLNVFTPLILQVWKWFLHLSVVYPSLKLHAYSFFPWHPSSFFKQWEYLLWINYKHIKRQHLNISIFFYSFLSFSFLFFLSFFLSFFFCPGTSSCRPGWPRTHRDPPASAFRVLGLKVCTTTVLGILLDGHRQHSSSGFFFPKPCPFV